MAPTATHTFFAIVALHALTSFHLVISAPAPIPQTTAATTATNSLDYTCASTNSYYSDGIAMPCGGGTVCLYCGPNVSPCNWPGATCDGSTGNSTAFESASGSNGIAGAAASSVPPANAASSIVPSSTSVSSVVGTDGSLPIQQNQVTDGSGVNGVTTDGSTTLLSSSTSSTTVGQEDLATGSATTASGVDGSLGIKQNQVVPQGQKEGSQGGPGGVSSTLVQSAPSSVLPATAVPTVETTAALTTAVTTEGAVTSGASTAGAGAVGGPFTDGQATYNPIGPDDMGSCSGTPLSTYTFPWVALSHIRAEVWPGYAFNPALPNGNLNPMCNGQKIKATFGSKSVTATIVDTCMGCAVDNLDFDKASFEYLVGSTDIGRAGLGTDYYKTNPTLLTWEWA